MYGEDDRTKAEVMAAIVLLPILVSEQDRKGRAVWFYQPVDAEGKPTGERIDAKKAVLPPAIGQELGERIFQRMALEDIIPTDVLDGPPAKGGRRGGLRKDQSSGVPHWEANAWRRKYAVAYWLNGERHFEVNDAWKRGTDPGAYFDLRRAGKLRVSQLVADESVAAVDDGDDGMDVGDVGAVAGVGEEPKRGRRR